MIRRALWTVVGLAVVGGAAAATYALWSAETPLTGAVLVHGDLDIELVGDAAWEQLAPVALPVGTVDGDRAAHLATPGDVLQLTQQFRTALEGENLAARLEVDWTEPADLGQGVTASYAITPPSGTPVPPVLFGEAVTVPEAPANLSPALLASWGTDPWTLTVTLTFDGADVVVDPSGIGTAPDVDLGTVELRLTQVRDGEGFDS